MANEGVIGPIRVEWRQQGYRVVMSRSNDRALVRRIADGSDLIEGVEVPLWIEMTTSGGPDPGMTVRVELRDGSPEVTELSWKSGPDQGYIRQKHLRQTIVAKLAADLMVSSIEDQLVPMTKVSDIEIPDGNFDDATLAAFRNSEAVVRSFMDRQRKPRARRMVTDELLQKVAQVYSENIDGNPTQAVQAAFNVQHRMASKYVEKARQAKLLPQTSRGQKKA